jgi:hypothetical protein
VPSFQAYLGDDQVSEDERSRRWRVYSDDAHEARMRGDVQPSLWCQWMPSDDGRAIVWDRGEKFQQHAEWLRYLLRHFLIPWGYVLNGRVDWQGPEPGEVGMISVLDNAVSWNTNVW